jgi:hypothetical protein
VRRVLFTARRGGLGTGCFVAIAFSASHSFGLKDGFGYG